MTACGVSAWDDLTTRQIIAMRNTRPNIGSGYYSGVTIKAERCGKAQDCGGACVLARGHLVPCECAGDNPGDPGSCPA